MRDLIVVRPARHAPLCAGRVRRVSGRLSFLRGVQRATSPSAYVYNSPHGHTGTRADTGWWGFHVVRFGQVRATLNLGRFGQVPGEPGPNLTEPDLEILNFGQVQVSVASSVVSALIKQFRCLRVVMAVGVCCGTPRLRRENLSRLCALTNVRERSVTSRVAFVGSPLGSERRRRSRRRPRSALVHEPCQGAACVHSCRRA